MRRIPANAARTTGVGEQRQSTCATQPTTNYLLYGTLPSDTTCKAIPLPDETQVFPVGPQDPNAQPTSATIVKPNLVGQLLAAVIGLLLTGRLPL